jgi:hypothetical protein
MSETAPQGTTGTIEQPDASGGNPDIRALRQAADDGKVARAEADQLKRELLFAKAGVDTEAKLGKMLLATWEGELTDVDALKAEWAELNPVQGEAKPPVQEQAKTPEGFQDPQGQQHHRDNTQGGQPAAGEQPSDRDPVDAALELFHSNKGRPMEDRQIDALGNFVAAFVSGDPRTRFDAKAWAQQQIRDSAGDLDAP